MSVGIAILRGCVEDAEKGASRTVRHTEEGEGHWSSVLALMQERNGDLFVGLVPRKETEDGWVGYICPDDTTDRPVILQRYRSKAGLPIAPRDVRDWTHRCPVHERLFRIFGAGEQIPEEFRDVPRRRF